MFDQDVEAYLREIDDWCKEKGLERADWCKENDHTWDNVPEEWPPQRRCVVCELKEERPPVEPFTEGYTCHKCGSKVIRELVDEKGCPRCCGKDICPDCKKFKVETYWGPEVCQCVTEEDAASGRLEEMLR